MKTFVLGLAAVLALAVPAAHADEKLKQDIAQDKADLAKDKSDLAKDRADVKKDRADVAKDSADLKKDANDVRADVKELRKAERDLKADEKKGDTADAKKDEAKIAAAKAALAKDSAVEGLYYVRAARTAASRSGATEASKSSARKRSTSACAAAGVGFHTVTRWMARTSRYACGNRLAIRPAPTTSSEAASDRARYDAASADTAAVRRAVMTLPSSNAIGVPCSASNRQ